MFIVVFAVRVDGDIVFRGCISSAHMHIWARNLRNLFSKLLILQNNQPPPCKPEPPAEQRRYCSLGEESWRGLLHLSIFPSLFFFTHHLFVIAWQRTVLGPAGCLVNTPSPKISSSQQRPFGGFATVNVYSYTGFTVFVFFFFGGVGGIITEVSESLYVF